MNLNFLVIHLLRNVITKQKVVVLNLFLKCGWSKDFYHIKWWTKKAKHSVKHVYLILVQITNHEEADYEDYEYDGHHEVGRQETAHHL